MHRRFLPYLILVPFHHTTAMYSPRNFANDGLIAVRNIGSGYAVRRLGS